MNKSNPNHKATNWDKYYRKPFILAHITRKILFLYLRKKLKILGFAEKAFSVCEFGGGNSCFFESLKLKFSISSYSIVDNNQLSLDILENKFPNDDSLNLYNANLLNPIELKQKSDLVFSFGLIEHFDSMNTALIIKRHFETVKKNGIVIISFPTLTFLYRSIRKIAEVFNVWGFPDERPLLFEEVESEIQKHGQIISRSTIWPIGLTQGLIVARANSI